VGLYKGSFLCLDMMDGLLSLDYDVTRLEHGSNEDMSKNVE